MPGCKFILVYLYKENHIDFCSSLMYNHKTKCVIYYTLIIEKQLLQIVKYIKKRKKHTTKRSTHTIQNSP